MLIMIEELKTKFKDKVAESSANWIRSGWYGYNFWVEDIPKNSIAKATYIKISKGNKGWWHQQSKNGGAIVVCLPYENGKK